MLHLSALKKLKVKSVELETVSSRWSSPPNPQIRLSAISDEVIADKRVAGEIVVYVSEDGRHGLIRMFRSGLFTASCGVEENFFRLLWGACAMPFEFFEVSLELRGAYEVDGEEREVDLALNYKVGKGKPAWQGLPSGDWIV
ncbi:hypothetical protein [Bradyrhizobium sp. SZCCHNR3015]|uniref:hypothetical protein n=1 Tax=Bradyrhizobium sp. SZCCHNR3015 TaxID=3057395 RepID=UPI002916D778|nr:hypothetical protein [Bradyrhizobium sp. SZCCHNR3015]